MIVKDVDGDIWEQNAFGSWGCRSRSDLDSYSLTGLAEMFGPLTFFNEGENKGPDTSVYRVTDVYGTVKHFGRRGMASSISNRYRAARAVKVERTETNWVDVSAEFLKGNW